MDGNGTLNGCGEPCGAREQGWRSERSRGGLRRHEAPESARDRDTERQGWRHRAPGTETQCQGQTRKPISRAAWVLNSIPVSLSEGGLRDCPCQPILIRNTLTCTDAPRSQAPCYTPSYLILSTSLCATCQEQPGGQEVNSYTKELGRHAGEQGAPYETKM